MTPRRSSSDEMTRPGHDWPWEEPTSREPESEGLWSLLTDRLAGRWKYAIPLAVLLGAGLCVAGYHSTEPRYESTGVVRVAPRITPIMRDTPETGVMPFYDNFMRTQAQLITSQRVLERAVQSLDLNEMPWSTHEQALSAIRRNVGAAADRRSELIGVTYHSESAHVAQTVVNAVLRAYDELYGSVDSEEITRNMQTLRAIREDLRNQRRTKRSQIQDLIASTEYSVRDFEGLIEQKAITVHDYEQEIRRLERLIEAEIERNPEYAEQAADDGEGEFALAGPSDRELEAFDPELERLGRQKREATDNYAQAQAIYTPRSRNYRRALDAVERIEARYEDRRMEVMEAYIAYRGDEITAAPTSIPQMRRHLEMLRNERDRQRVDAQEMRQTQFSLDDLRAELTDIEHDLGQANARIRDLEIESDQIRQGRISIAQMGDRPGSPNRDQRKQRAAVGLVAGVGMAFGLFFLLGTIDRRAYAAKQLQQGFGSTRLLGILPALPRRHDPHSAGDLETCGVAAHCVHQIRNHLESTRRRSSQPAAIAVSSPYQGDGKTSLTLALGASYAASGYRTLLIDADLVGQSLTHHCMLDGQPGFKETIANPASANDQVTPLGMDNLSVMPVGADAHIGPASIRRSHLEAILAELRNHYDMILLDTGPLPGSVESLPVATAADGVVFILWRGRRRGRLQEALDTLRSTGGECLGIVLNYARAADCDHYVSRSSLSAAVTSSRARNSSNGTGSAQRRATLPRNMLLQAMEASRGSDDD